MYSTCVLELKNRGSVSVGTLTVSKTQQAFFESVW